MRKQDTSAISVFERVLPYPINVRDPFEILGAGPDDGTAELSRKAEHRQLRAGTDQEEILIRDALRELTTHPSQRAGWECFASHVDRSHATDVVEAEPLARFLLGGIEPHPATRSQVTDLACFLNGNAAKWSDDRLKVDADLMQRWWSAATHRAADKWEYWHLLARFYHHQASASERERLTAEQQPDSGAVPVDAGWLDAVWLRTCQCWDRVLQFDAFWERIRLHVESLPGFQASEFDQLREQFPIILVSSFTEQIRIAVKDRNRLAVARHRRHLARLNSSEFRCLGPHVPDALDDLKYSLLQIVEKRTDPLAKFEELLAGLLILWPDDRQIVSPAFAAVVTMGNREQNEDPPHVDTATRMAQLLRAYDHSMNAYAFPDYPRPQPVNPQATRDELVQLHWYYALSRIESPVSEKNRLEEYEKALGELL